MLQMAMDDRQIGEDAAMAAPATVTPIATLSMGVAARGGDSRYGARGRPNLPVIALIVLLHVVLIVIALQVRHSYVRAKEAQLKVVNLTPPPPPPAEQPETPPETQPPVVAPPPLVRVPVPPVPVPTSPEPPLRPSITPVAIAPPIASFAPPAPPSIVQGGDLSAQMVSGKPPRYPIDSRRKREQGTVLVSVIVGLDGAVEKISVAKSSGFARLDDAALDAIRHWRWRPMLDGGQPVRVKGVVEIPFVIQG
jgi:protein TonB